jgi:hypothetical protein
VTRVLALVVAVGLIVGAVFLRSAFDDDEAATATGEDGPVRVVCATELAAACAEVDGDVEDAARTASRLIGEAQPDLDVWVAPAPWPAMVDDARTRAGRDALFDDATVVARSPITIVAGGDPGDCGWRCIGDGTDTLGMPSPDAGFGLLVLGAAATDWFGTADFAANDFDPAFRSWITGLADRIVVTDDPVRRILQSRAFFDLAVSYEASARSTLDAASADRKDGLSLQYPHPMTFLDATVAAVGGVGTSITDAAGDALLANGWTAPASTPTGLPRPGVLLALQELLG